MGDSKGRSAGRIGVAVLFMAVAVTVGGAGCATTTTERLNLPELKTVEHVDLSRYLGTWYDIASFPQWFQRGCTATTARYTLKDNGEIEVVNACRKGALDGKLKESRGRARVVDVKTNARIEVSFFGNFWGDYWIVELGPDYEYSVVGSPSRDYLWILSRTPRMDGVVYNGILQRLKEQGYEVERLVLTPQPVPGGEKVDGGF